MAFGDFPDSIAAKMEAALSLACGRLPAGEDTHKNRKRIAQKIIDCATSGKTELRELIEAANSRLPTGIARKLSPAKRVSRSLDRNGTRSAQVGFFVVIAAKIDW